MRLSNRLYGALLATAVVLTSGFCLRSIVHAQSWQCPWKESDWVSCIQVGEVYGHPCSDSTWRFNWASCITDPAANENAQRTGIKDSSQQKQAWQTEQMVECGHSSWCRWSDWFNRCEENYVIEWFHAPITDEAPCY